MSRRAGSPDGAIACRSAIKDDLEGGALAPAHNYDRCSIPGQQLIGLELNLLAQKKS